MKMRSYNFCHTNTKNPGNNLGIFLSITGRPKSNGYDMTLDTAQYKRMYQRITAIEFSILRIGEYPIPSIIDIVNCIRLAKGNVFAEWKNSETAKFFEDHGYKNKKQAGGYFF